MGGSRRDFLKKVGAGGALATTSTLLASTARADCERKKRVTGGGMLPAGLTVCTLARGDEWELGVRTERGILDVEAASDHFDVDDVPESVDELLQEGGGKA